MTICFFEETLSADYVENSICDGCNTKMKAIAIIENLDGKVGLITGLCSECGYIKRINNLSVEAYSSHFSNKWLVRREEETVENKHVYNRLKPYIQSKGKVLDVGCGLGGSLLPLHNLGYDVYGVEPSKHRSEKGREIIKNIETGNAEEYLSSSNNIFEVIYFFDVLQFVVNPFAVLEMAISHLSDTGKIYIKMGAFGHKSNYSQFSHIGVIRNVVNLYALKSFFERMNVYPVYYNAMPCEFVLSKQKNEKTDSILKSAMKTDEVEVKKFIKRTLKTNRLKVFGKTTLTYSGRKTSLILQRPMGDLLPVVFCHGASKNKVPLLLK